MQNQSLLARFTQKSTILLLLIFLSCNSEVNRQGGVCLSFDDRSVKEWYGMRHLLNRYDARVTFFVTQFDSLDSTEINMLKELQHDGHEIGSHGALHVISEDYIKKYSYKKYLQDEVEASLSSMRNKGFYPTSFAYPFGAKYWFTDFLLLKQFSVVRGVEKVNDEHDISRMKKVYYQFDGNHTPSAIGIDQLSGITKDMIQKAMKRATDREEVLLLYGHSPASAADSSSYTFDMDLLEFVLKEANKDGLKYFRMSEL